MEKFTERGQAGRQASAGARSLPSRVSSRAYIIYNVT